MKSKHVVAVVVWAALVLTGCSPNFTAEDLETTAINACHKSVKSLEGDATWVRDTAHGDPPERVTGQARLGSGDFAEFECTITWNSDKSEATSRLTHLTGYS